MAVNNADIAEIVHNCCSPLSYDIELQQFVFGPQRDLRLRVERLRSTFAAQGRKVYPEDFNLVLRQAGSPGFQGPSVSVNNLAESEVMTGEIICMTFGSAEKPLMMVKMSASEYLSREGRRCCYGSGNTFRVGGRLIDSDGHETPVIRSIEFIMPSQSLIAAGSEFIGNYYRIPVADSLWELTDISDGIRSKGLPADGLRLCRTARSLGVGPLTLLSIINAAHIS